MSTEAQKHIARFEARRGYPLTEAEKRQVEVMCDDPFGGVYDPRPVISPTAPGNGWLSECD